MDKYHQLLVVPGYPKVIKMSQEQAPSSMFGISLEEVLTMQKRLNLSHDHVHTWNLLKARDAIGRGNHPCDDFSTPYIFADLLRMWIEGLPGHLIPDEYFGHCLRCSDRKSVLKLIDDLPKLNRRVLVDLVKFLQDLLLPENTRLNEFNEDRIARVWSHYLLPLPRQGYEETQWLPEQVNFVTLLLRHIN